METLTTNNELVNAQVINEENKIETLPTKTGLVTAQVINEADVEPSNLDIEMIGYLTEETGDDVIFCSPRKWSKVKHAYPEATYYLGILQYLPGEEDDICSSMYAPIYVKVK